MKILKKTLLVLYLFSSSFCPEASMAAESGQDSSTQTNTTMHSAQVAKAFDLERLISRLKAFQKKANHSELTKEEKILAVQHIIYLRQKIGTYLQEAVLDVDSTVAFITLESSDIMDMQAKVIDRRSRSLKRENMINFVTGSVTKVTGKSLGLANFSIPDDVLDIIDGGVQGILSIASIRSSREQSTMKEMPHALLAVLNEGKTADFVFPGAVWWYLNERIPGNEMLPCQRSGCTISGNTRKERLIAKWTDDGFLSNQKDSRKKPMFAMASNLMQTQSYTSKLLDDRSAMLSDLRSVISQMKLDLGLISKTIRETYKDDIEIDISFER